jgi:hypothetical protein
MLVNYYISTTHHQYYPPSDNPLTKTLKLTLSIKTVCTSVGSPRADGTKRRARVLIPPGYLFDFIMALKPDGLCIYETTEQDSI